MNASASADGRNTKAWPQLDNVTLRDVSNAHVQGGRRHYQQSESGAGKRTGLTQLKTERAKDLPHGGVDGSMLPNQRPGDARSGLRREQSSDNTQA
jgi:protein required for attachment to host cells